MIIALEGINGAGKTTIANRLNRDFGWEVVHHPCVDHDAGDLANKLLEKQGPNIATSALSLIAMAEIKAQSLKDTIYIWDRAQWSTVAYSGMEGTKLELMTNIALEKTSLPDLCLYLGCSVDVAMERIKAREHKSTNPTLEQIETAAQIYEDLFYWESFYWESGDYCCDFRKVPADGDIEFTYERVIKQIDLFMESLKEEYAS